MEKVEELEEFLRSIQTGRPRSSHATLITDFLIRLNKVYDSGDPNWEHYLGKLSGLAPSKVHSLYERNDDLQDIHPDADIQFSILFSLFKVCLHRDDLNSMRPVIDEYDSEFGSRPMYSHAKALYYRKAGGGPNIRQAIDLELEVVDEYGAHSGAHHHLARLIVEYVEGGHEIGVLDSVPDDRSELLDQAMYHVDTAIDIEPEYALYIATKGRVLAQQRRYDDARETIQKAIAYEDTDKGDYSLRISQYRQFLADVGYYEQTERLEKADQRIEGLEEESRKLVSEFQTQTLEFLGFFAAIIAVAVASVTIATNFPFPDAARLILVMIGGVLSAFAGLSFVLPSRRPRRGVGRSAIVFIVGLLIIISGYILPTIV